MEGPGDAAARLAARPESQQRAALGPYVFSSDFCSGNMGQAA